MLFKSKLLRIITPNLLIEAANTRCSSHGDLYVARVAPLVPDNVMRNFDGCGLAYCCIDVVEIVATLIRGGNPAILCLEEV